MVKTDWLRARVSVPGVVPLAVTVTKLPPVPGVNVAVNGTPGVVLVTWTVCESGTEPPTVNVKGTVVAESVRVFAFTEPTARLTGMYSGLFPAPGTMMVTTPLNVPWDSALPSAVTVTVLPFTAVCSQPVPLNSAGIAPMVVPAGTPLIVIVFGAGGVPPNACAKASCDKLALMFEETMVRVT